jgi:hypothetical protein
MNHAVNDGSIFSAQTIGGAVFGLVSGYLSTEFGLPIAFIVAGLLMLLGSGWAFTWLNHTSTSPEASSNFLDTPVPGAGATFPNTTSTDLRNGFGHALNNPPLGFSRYV